MHCIRSLIFATVLILVSQAAWAGKKCERNISYSLPPGPISDTNGLCTVTGKCKILMGLDHSEQPRLADLLVDILQIMNAPENAWVHSNARPPADVTVRLAEFLRDCFKMADTFKTFVVHHCLEHDTPPAPQINREHMIHWTPTRERLMRQYMHDNTGSSSTALPDPTTIVVHWTGSSNGEATLGMFQNEKTDRKELKVAGEANVACHFLVDRQGRIFQMMEEDHVGRHAVGMNRTALCIENVGGWQDVDRVTKKPIGRPHELTPEQSAADEQLIRYLIARHPSIDHIVGHGEAETELVKHSYLYIQTACFSSDRDDEPGTRWLADLRRRLFEDGEAARRAGRCGPEGD